MGRHDDVQRRELISAIRFSLSWYALFLTRKTLSLNHAPSFFLHEPISTTDVNGYSIDFWERKKLEVINQIHYASIVCNKYLNLKSWFFIIIWAILVLKEESNLPFFNLPRNNLSQQKYSGIALFTRAHREVAHRLQLLQDRYQILYVNISIIKK